MMNQMNAELAELQAAAFSALGQGGLKSLVAFLRKKAELAAYECSQIGAPEDFRRDCMATIRFCHGFADKAEEALNARRAEATERREGGFQ